MELNLFNVKLVGGVMYTIESVSKTSQDFILALARSNVFVIEKTGQMPKYLFFDQMVEVQQIELTNTARENSWILKEKK